MRIWSNDFADGQPIPDRCSYRLGNKRPHLAWDDIPRDTKSFAIICNDPDAPVGNWIHWLVHAIPAEVYEIASDEQVPGIQIQNDFGILDWGGPAPPFGTHRYFFSLYALKIPAMEAVDKNSFKGLCEKHKIAVAQTMGTYTRQ
jgi:Raf kinase inhibitor-like YbhB/YbcL family protein